MILYLLIFIFWKIKFFSYVDFVSFSFFVYEQTQVFLFSVCLFFVLIDFAYMLTSLSPASQRTVSADPTMWTDFLNVMNILVTAYCTGNLFHFRIARCVSLFYHTFCSHSFFEINTFLISGTEPLFRNLIRKYAEGKKIPWMASYMASRSCGTDLFFLFSMWGVRTCRFCEDSR